MDGSERKPVEEALLEMNRTLKQQGALLRSREEMLRVIVKNVPAGIAVFDRDMRYVQASDRWRTTYSVDGWQILGHCHYDIFPDLPERYKEIHRRGLSGETVRTEDDRWDREGRVYWSHWEVRPWRNAEGAVGGILILVEDIAHRKQMEETLAGMSRKLIESQEQERARIGRELHDDINQRLAMLSMGLETLQLRPSEFKSRIQELRKELCQISNDVQSLSHDLHSSKLQYLGAIAGMKGWCREVCERHKVDINFENDFTRFLPLEIGLPLFRVLQEAVHNAIKHSGEKSIEVKLQETAGELHLVVRDSGAGFDCEAALRGKGLGLTSMKERIRLVNGTIAIDSQPKSGTTVHVRVPLESENLRNNPIRLNQKRSVGI
jgi:PAS domain S-box-containing protein